MRFATFAALFVFVAVAADTRQPHHDISLVPVCDDPDCVIGDITGVPAASDRKHPAKAVDASGNPAGVVISRKTGARARVGTAHAARFQAYIDDLEINFGARVLFMGGIRPGRCSPSSEHPCGKALDVCQTRRGVVDPRCHLPGRVALGRIAASHGLFEGGLWCNSDYGHAQVDVTASACSERRLRLVHK